MPNSNLNLLLKKASSFFPKEIDLSLDRMKSLLALLGNPEQKIAPVIHVAGTNGKGSTIAFMRAILEASGYRVHVYTSPHLCRFKERIRLSGQLIDDKVLESLLPEVMTVAEKNPVTFFELTTAVAFLAFSQYPADIVLLETGMGGRLDATNVIPKPLATVITPISYDHMDYLGNTLSEIAREKAGIIKAGVPLVVGDQVPEVYEVLMEKAKALKCPVLKKSQELYSDIALLGAHQVMNAGVALATLEAVKSFYPTSHSHRQQGLKAVQWPGRLQRLEDETLIDLCPPGSELWLDGAHNQAGGEVLKEVLSEWCRQENRPLVGIIGMSRSKDPEELLKPIVPYFDHIIAVSLREQESHSPETLVKIIEKLDPSKVTFMANSLKQAFKLFEKKIINYPRILVTGSLYLVGETLACNGTVPD